MSRELRRSSRRGCSTSAAITFLTAALPAPTNPAIRSSLSTSMEHPRPRAKLQCRNMPRTGVSAEPHGFSAHRARASRKKFCVLRKRGLNSQWLPTKWARRRSRAIFLPQCAAWFTPKRVAFSTLPTPAFAPGSNLQKRSSIKRDDPRFPSAPSRHLKLQGPQNAPLTRCYLPRAFGAMALR